MPRAKPCSLAATPAPPEPAIRVLQAWEGTCAVHSRGLMVSGLVTRQCEGDHEDDGGHEFDRRSQPHQNGLSLFLLYSMRREVYSGDAFEQHDSTRLTAGRKPFRGSLRTPWTSVHVSSMHSVQQMRDRRLWDSGAEIHAYMGSHSQHAFKINMQQSLSVHGSPLTATHSQRHGGA